MASVAYLVTLRLEAIQTAPSDCVATALMARVFTARGELLTKGIIVVSTIGCNNRLILAGARA